MLGSARQGYGLFYTVLSKELGSESVPLFFLSVPFHRVYNGWYNHNRLILTSTSRQLRVAGFLRSGWFQPSALSQKRTP